MNRYWYREWFGVEVWHIPRSRLAKNYPGVYVSFPKVRTLKVWWK